MVPLSPWVTRTPPLLLKWVPILTRIAIRPLPLVVRVRVVTTGDPSSMWHKARPTVRILGLAVVSRTKRLIALKALQGRRITILCLVTVD